MATRRRKIAHAVASRRVKPRKSKNAKRPKSKTFKRTSRNIVMKGGIHKNLKVYVIQNNLGKPKCFIIRQPSTPKDTIYLFFDADLPNEELKTFLCAALDLKNIEGIQPQFNIPDESNKKAFKTLFVKLYGNAFYTLSSGNLPTDKFFTLSDVKVTNYTTPGFITGNGENVIQRLKTKTEKFSGYTFTYKTSINSFCLYVLNSLFGVVMTEFCNKDEVLNKNLKELQMLVDKQFKLSRDANDYAHMFALGKGAKVSKEDDKKYYIEKAKQEFTFTEEDVKRAGELINYIKNSENYEKCKDIYKDIYKDGILFMYLNGEDTFKTIEQIFTDQYNKNR